ncbi:MAG: alpha/beta hydrolase [Alphaproteobacteria bacterium]|nr:MAG: alpha/beta hydrolase [Alphaproteobacteria bacterium]
MGKILKSGKFWLVFVLTAPLLLVGCSSLFVDFDSHFTSDEYVARATTPAPGIDSLSYLHRGDADGQRVIFVHGTPGDAAAWYDMLKAAPAGYEFLSVDRPGFGQTLPDKAMVSLDGQAAALEPLLHPKNGRKPILVGHSLGGPVVVAAAAKYPDLIGGIVVVAGALDPDLEDVMFIQYVGDVPPFSWLLAAPMRHMNRELIGLEDELRILAPKLADIHVPVTIIHGTRDDLVPYANVAYMEKMFTGTSPKLVTLEGQNHFLPWNSAGVIVSAVTDMASSGAGDGALPESQNAR